MLLVKFRFSSTFHQDKFIPQNSPIPFQIPQIHHEFASPTYGQVPELRFKRKSCEFFPKKRFSWGRTYTITTKLFNISNDGEKMKKKMWFRFNLFVVQIPSSSVHGSTQSNWCLLYYSFSYFYEDTISFPKNCKPLVNHLHFVSGLIACWMFIIHFRFEIKNKE